MFGLGIPEILFIVLIAVIILGPEHMPKAATMLGKWSAKMRSAATSLSQAVSQDDDLREIHQSVKTVHAELASAKQELLRPITDTKQELIQPIADTKQDLLVSVTGARQSIQEAREELKHLSGVASDDEMEDKAESTGDMVSEGPKESDFMHRPIRWFDDDDKPLTSEDQDREGNQSYRLSRSRFLPEAVARAVKREQILLKPRLSTELSTADCVVCKLQPSDPKRAWCKPVRLCSPRVHPQHTIISLAIPPTPTPV